MKKLIALFLASLCLLGLVACFPVDPGYSNTVAYAGWSDDPIIEEGSLNWKELIQNEDGARLPIFKIDTLEDLEQFRPKYGNVFSLDQDYNGALSFNGALAKAQWDREAFFKDNSLLAVYVPANSGSFRFGVHHVEVTDNRVCVHVVQKNNPDVVTDDMAGWFVLVEIEDKELRSCNSFDAILVDTE